MKKKAQAAMEFLMTYGWAILVVLAAIAALAYFGVLSPDKFLPEKCQFPSGFGCVDFTADSTTQQITLVMQNGAGFSPENLQFSLAADSGCVSGGGALTNGITTATLTAGDFVFDSLADGTGTDYVGPSVAWPNGDKAFLVIECDALALTSGDKANEKITISYDTSNGLSKSVSGDVQIKIQ